MAEDVDAVTPAGERRLMADQTSDGTWSYLPSVVMLAISCVLIAVLLVLYAAMS